MKRNSAIFAIWLALVILWNYGVPGALPLWDVAMAVGLSFFSSWMHRLLESSKAPARFKAPKKEPGA